jgi:hypothetical protein
MHRLFADEALKTQTKFQRAEIHAATLLQQTLQHEQPYT